MCRSDDHGGRRCPNEMSRSRKDQVNTRRRELRKAHQNAGVVTLEHVEPTTWRNNFDRGDVVWLPIVGSDGGLRTWSGPFVVVSRTFDLDNPQKRLLKLKDFGEVDLTAEQRAIGLRKVRAIYAETLNGIREALPAKSTQMLEGYENMFPLAAPGRQLASDEYAMGCETETHDVAESKEWGDTLTYDESEAIKDYCGNTAVSINRGLRDDRPDYHSDFLKKSIAHIRDALNKGDVPDNPVTVYRGVSHVKQGMDILQSKEEMDAWVDKEFQVGSTFVDKSFISTSPDPSVGSSFASSGEEGGGVVFEISTRHGRPTNSVSGLGVLEAERLLPDGLQFKVIGVSRNIEGNFYQKPMTVVHLMDISPISS